MIYQKCQFTSSHFLSKCVESSISPKPVDFETDFTTIWSISERLVGHKHFLLGQFSDDFGLFVCKG